MNGSFRALDGSVLDFVTPAIGQASLYNEFRTQCMDEQTVPVDHQGMPSKCFSAWYCGIKTFRDCISFIKRRGEDNYCGYVITHRAGDALEVNVTVLDAYTGNGYARAAILFACNYYACEERPPAMLYLMCDKNNYYGCKLVAGFGAGREVRMLKAYLATRVPIKELIKEETPCASSMET